MTRQPDSLTIRTYNVGFGDCFLLTFAYAGGDPRHVLIDFGSQATKGGAGKVLTKVAQSIRDVTGGKLHVVVATHRHQDHIRGFGLKDAGEIIESLNPDVILQPWTEDPDIETDATAPVSSKPAGSAGLRQAHIRQLRDMNALAEHYFSDPGSSALKGLKAADPALHAKLSFTGENNIKNRAAVAALLRMAERGKGKYLHAGQNAGLSRLLPGVKVEVLGPPTVDQHEPVRKQAARQEDEYWHLHAAAAASAAGTGSFAGLAGFETMAPPVSARWFAHRLRRLRLDGMLAIVRALDHAMNNTSLILLFTVADKALLFPGDAQYENWQYALSQPEIMAKLAKVDVYKVGHHGSLNATPRSLWDAFEMKGPARRSGKRLKTLLSTLQDKHGDEGRNTEVPRRTLVRALKSHSDVTHTQDFDDHELFREIVIRF